MRVVHQRCIPNEPEHKEENERREECEKEFRPIHNSFLLRFTVPFLILCHFIARREGNVDFKLVGRAMTVD
jgi:hypothetical protein